MPNLSQALKKVTADKPLPKSRRVEALFADIEEAITKGYTREQIIRALRDFDIELTPQQLSTYLARIRSRRANASPAPQAPPAPAAPTPSPADDASKFGAHDPRRIDAVISSPPDMKALSKLARGSKR